MWEEALFVERKGVLGVPWHGNTLSPLQHVHSLHQLQYGLLVSSLHGLNPSSGG